MNQRRYDHGKGTRLLPLLTLVPWLLAACASWVQRPGSAMEVVRTSEAPRVRIQARGETVVLQFPRILGDSLAGSTTTPGGMRVIDERVMYGLDEIVVLEVEEFDWDRTALAVGGTLGAWFLALAWAWNNAGT